MTSSGRRRRARLRAFLVVLIVALPLGVYLWGRSSSAFAVQRIELSGARRVSAAKAARTLRARFLGYNLFGVRAAQVAAALESFPYFAHVEIDRDFPNTLRVRIVEYRPAAVLFSAGRWYVVSRGGRVLLRLPGTVAPPTAASGAGAAAQGSAGNGQSRADGAAASANAATTAVSVNATASAAPGTGGGASTGGETGPSSTATDSTTASATGAAASDAAANDAAALAASLSSSALGTQAHVPSLFAGDLTAGILAAARPPRQADRLPVLVTKKKVKVGGSVADRSVRDALALLQAVPQRLRAQVLYVTVSPAGIDAVLRNGVTYAFGDVHDLANKVLALQAVLAVYRRHHLRATWVEVSVPNRPLGTPVIVSRAAQVQSAHPTPKASPTPKATTTPRVSQMPKTRKTSPSPATSSSPVAGKSSSPTPRQSTAAASP